MEKKFCSKCRLYLDIVNFKKVTTKKYLNKCPDGYYWHCIECYKKTEFVYVKGEEPQNRQARRRDKLAKRIASVENLYSMSEHEYIKKINEQGNLCAICLKKDKTKVLCVDHDHTTKKVRGLLCHNCNVGLGNFKDNPKILESAIAYLLEKGDALKQGGS